ncbi:MAG TPA: methyl-accepting chemotaxis protein [Ktedonobacteraceae bacterium]
MLKLISSYPISRRLIIAFALAAILPSVMIAVMGIYYVNQLSSHRTASSIIASVQDSTNNWSHSLQRLYTQTKAEESQVLSVVLSPDPVNHAKVKGSLQQATTLILQNSGLQEKNLMDYKSQYDPLTGQLMPSVISVVSMVAPNDSTSEDGSALLKDISESGWSDFKKAQAAELKQLNDIMAGSVQIKDAAGTANKISSAAADLDAAYDDVSTDWILLSQDVATIAKHVNGDTNEAQPIIYGTAGAFLLTLFVVTIAGILVHRSISGPLDELVLLTRRISKGDRLARAHINSHDEIAIVATAMNNMLDNIVHLVHETQSQRDLLQGQVEKLVSEVSGVGDGDLSVSAEVTADALGVLADSFNYMVEELSSLVVRVKKVAHEVQESTSLTTDRMAELVETSDRQIQEIAHAAMEIERMANNSQQVANRAMALASSAREARISAQGGRQAVQQTIEGMGRIQNNVQQTSGKVQTLGERSREINNIVEAISNIAHQTNRLALDAAIQAAMAGENGKGFGAVAADIRRLAERAKELASSVGRIVRSVRDEIGAVAISMNDTERETSTGSILAAEAGTSLESIVAVIERQADEIERINQMAVQQRQSSNDVVQMMQHVSETTEQSTASTRDAAQNIERVDRLAEQLLVSVEAFKLRDNQNYVTPDGRPYDENLDGLLTPAGSFRKVTATAQPVNNGNGYNNTPSLPGVEGFFPQFPQFSPSLQSPRNVTGPFTQPPQWGEGQRMPSTPPHPGQQSLPAWPNGNNQQSLPAWPNGNNQQSLLAWSGNNNPQPSPAQNNWPPEAYPRPGGTQPLPPGTQPRPADPQARPALNDWQTGNRNQSNW